MSSTNDKMLQDVDNLSLFVKKYKALISSRAAAKTTLDNLDKDVTEQLEFILRMLNFHGII